MPIARDADTIRVLVATDNHVGYNERDHVRGEDSWRTFHEIMTLAKSRDVDMVLLAGDLFHDNKPSRKSMFQVMRSLRLNCFGNKPCELELLSDSTENFQGAFDHVNYEDPDINVAIPVFSIHGNHDDPSGENHLAALDLLQVSGLVNYYGRTPESDNIAIKPVLLQKGHTKLALYGMSNVRDERLYRTFRDGKVKFFQPSTQKDNWFNLMSVHQNRHEYTKTGYLPAEFLPEFVDLVIWGHEHECKIDPTYVPTSSFHIIQPGSSVATSLMPGEAVTKHVCLLSITGKEFQSEPIRLKTVRPFIMKEIVLQEEKGMRALSKKDDNRAEISRHLQGIVQDMIEEAKQNWLDAQEDGQEDELEVPLPLIRLRVEYTAPEGGKFDCENPQRFSNRFEKQVANRSDVIQYHRRKTTTRKAKDGTELPEESIMAQLNLDTVKVEKLVREFLTAQSLTVLPQNSFGDAVSQFVDKDDKHAMDLFVTDALDQQVQHILTTAAAEDELADIPGVMTAFKSRLEQLWASGHVKKSRRAKLKPRPAHWDSDLDGEWAEQPGAYVLSDLEDEPDEDENEEGTTLKARPVRVGKGKIAVSAIKAGRKTAAKGKPAATMGHSTKRAVVEEDDEDDGMMLVDNDYNEEEEEEVPRFRQAKQMPAAKSKPVPASKGDTMAAGRIPARTNAPRSSAAGQTQLNFSPSSSTQPRRGAARGKPIYELSDDEISDDDGAFEPAPATTRSNGRG